MLASTTGPSRQRVDVAAMCPWTVLYITMLMLLLGAAESGLAFQNTDMLDVLYLYLQPVASSISAPRTFKWPQFAVDALYAASITNALLKLLLSLNMCLTKTHFS